jgi:hypothetical protein
MTGFGDAAKVMAGDTPAVAVYAGDVKVWPLVPPGPAASGGVVTQDGEWTVHTLSDSGNIEVTGGGDFEILLIAGGGAGGSRGGGAGGVINKTVTLTPGTYPVVIGDGGPAVASNVEASNGANSTFNGETAIGGGAGGHQPGPANGKDGGSGGAGIGFNSLGGAGTPGQGNAGGGGFTGNGGGAGSSGDGTVSLGIEVWGTFYASGGTAGTSNMPGADPTALPNPGGGGRGSQGPVAAEAGVDGTGGGGGGGGMNDSWTAFGLCGKGGKGIFKIRYRA